MSDSLADGALHQETHGDVGGSGDVDGLAHADVPLVPCEINWEDVRSQSVQTTNKLTHFTRPFFTMCKDGKFYWDDWHEYADGVTPEQVTSAGQEVRCPSGECKWGMCREDAEFIESQIPAGTQMQNALFRMYNASCIPCNPNNKAFSFDFDTYGHLATELCEGTYECCGEPMGENGACVSPMWSWEMYVQASDPLIGLSLLTGENMYGHEWDDCLETANDDCGPTDNARCIPGAATMITSRWAEAPQYNCIWIEGQRLAASEIRLTMGTSDRMRDLLMSPQRACDGSRLADVSRFTYFTCSGMATIKVSDGRWYKFVWIHEYDRTKCSQPCWMAADVGLPTIPVKMAFWQIAPEPAW